jgi:hydroxymethylglutaryl-CoA lyase
MPSFPKSILINEEGPREGFQFEKKVIPTVQKIELIDALAKTGLKSMKIASFVHPKLVPGMADSEEVVAGITPQDGVSYHGMWFNERGLQRALSTKRLSKTGGITLCASDAFLKRNKNRTLDEDIAIHHKLIKQYIQHNIDINGVAVSSAFGCNFQGPIEVPHVLKLIQKALDIGVEHDLHIKNISLYDTMAWATPNQIKNTVGAAQDKYPDHTLALHLHNTRGMGIANAFAALEMGVRHFDSSVGGLGGCPFAAHQGAAGNVCTEDLVFMCEEIGISTGIDLEAMIECAHLAEDIVGHPLPGATMKSGGLSMLRKKISSRGDIQH